MPPPTTATTQAVNQPEPTPEVTKPTIRVDHTSEGFKDFFATDLATIQKRIDTSDRYRDLIPAEVIQKINHKVHTLSYKEFERFNALHISNDEFRMWASYQNIYYEDPRMDELIKTIDIDDADDLIYYETRTLWLYRSNAEIAGIIDEDEP